jgi:kynurenine formamidase
MVRADGSSAANDLIVLGTHVGTHIDALCHVSYRGVLCGGHDAATAQSGGRFSVHGIDRAEPFLCRGVLLDIPAALGMPECAPGYEITPADLAAAEGRMATQIRDGDVVMIRSGWGRRWGEGPGYLGTESGVPGVSEAGARWLAERSPRAVGADTIAFEWLAPGAGHALLPAHRVLLVDYGIHIIETVMLEELANDGVAEYLFVAVPLPLTGATGSPVRPLAVVPGA